MVRHRMTDDQWDCVEDLFGSPAKAGRPRRDPRTMLDGVLWVLRTGAPWRDLPQEFGPWQSVYHWFNQWNKKGTLDAVLQRLRAACVDVGDLDAELWCVDGSIVRAARCAGGGGKKGARKSLTTAP